MSTVTVTTQAELDRAIADGAGVVYIDSPAGVWLTLRESGSSRVVARRSSRVVARRSSHVEAWDSSHVEAWGSSHVVARGSSRVVARGSSRVEAWDSSRVVAWGSSRVEAWDSSHVEAWDSSHVEAGTHVAVHLHSQRVTITGGVIIDMTAVDPTDPTAWCGMHGARLTGPGTVTLYKAVDDQYRAGHGYRLTTYRPGTTVTAPDWRDDNTCGGGLHLSPHPVAARAYYPGAARFVAVEVPLDAIRPIPGGEPKCKVRECRVVGEVDLWREIADGAA